ncbi:TAXI family TRAP transporter solute-binding subunit [Alsobacter sp. SYSU BS001988]
MTLLTFVTRRQSTAFAIALGVAAASCTRSPPPAAWPLPPRRPETPHPNRPRVAAAAGVGERPAAMAQAEPPPRPAIEAAPASPRAFGIASREQSGSFWRLVADLDEVLARDALQVKPMTTRGPVQALRELLRNPGVDAAVVQVDALQAFRGSLRDRLSQDRLRYVARLYDEDAHLVARREIGDVRQLSGKKVDVFARGSGSHVTGASVFRRLGIAPVWTFHGELSASRLLAAGKADAVFIVAQRPSMPVLELPDSVGRLLAIDWRDGFEEAYRRAALTSDDYPNLLAPSERIDTVAVSTVLAMCDWPLQSPGYGRAAQFLSAFYGRLGDLRGPGRHFDWGPVDAGAGAGGWTRLTLAELLDPRSGTGPEGRPAPPAGAGRPTVP